jgi:hypothetical protein
MDDMLPSEKERIEEIFRELDIETDIEDLELDEILDYTEAGFEPGDMGL